MIAPTLALGGMASSAAISAGTLSLSRADPSITSISAAGACGVRCVIVLHDPLRVVAELRYEDVLARVASDVDRLARPRQVAIIDRARDPERSEHGSAD